MILLFVPVVGAVIGLILGRFLRLSPPSVRRLITGGILLASPCVAKGPGGWNLEPLVHVGLEQVTGHFSPVNATSVLLVILLVGVGHLTVERGINVSSTKGSCS